MRFTKYSHSSARLGELTRPGASTYLTLLLQYVQVLPEEKKIALASSEFFCHQWLSHSLDWGQPGIHQPKVSGLKRAYFRRRSLRRQGWAGKRERTARQSERIASIRWRYCCWWKAGILAGTGCVRKHHFTVISTDNWTYEQIRAQLPCLLDPSG